MAGTNTKTSRAVCPNRISKKEAKGLRVKSFKCFLREANKSRVIRFHFKRNASTSPWFRDEQISFCGSPALHLNYEVLWKVGNNLYRQHDPKMPLEYAGAVKDRFDEGTSNVIEWTEERERFFESMVQGLVGLIRKVEDFSKNLAVNVDLAITSHTTPMLGHTPDRATETSES